jgi:ATP-dependent exoDNAse (exonuclease V) alpha subunit
MAQLQPRIPHVSASLCVSYAESRGFEREAVVDERQLLRDALKLAVGEVSLNEVRLELERRRERCDVLEVSAPPGVAGRLFTTREMLTLERENIELMLAGQQGYPEIGGDRMAGDLRSTYPHLSHDQWSALAQICITRDRVVALDGIAGAGKTTTLAAVRLEAERGGYRVEGLAPTSRAAQLLAQAGIRSRTLQEHLVASRQAGAEQASRLYVMDESSLAGTRQMHTFLHGLRPTDRVLLVGDRRQHQGIEAGRPFDQLQDAGLRTVRLESIVRQTNPTLKAVVEHLAQGDVVAALWQLDRQGAILEIADRRDRLGTVATAYVRSEGRTLVISPDNQSRVEINTAIHHARQASGQITRREHTVRVLLARQDVTGADRAWAGAYQVDDVIRYTKGSRSLGVHPGEYARVTAIDRDQNRITARLISGEERTYDPRRLSGVAVYREEHRAFAEGDRLQFTAPDRHRHLANRALGTLEAIDDRGVQIRLDSGRTVRVPLADHAHLDYGYAVTSYSSQGQTADRVLIHIDAERAPDMLVNRRLAYVAVSRARADVQVFTNDRGQLMHALDRDVSHQTALQFAKDRAKQQLPIGLGL